MAYVTSAISAQRRIWKASLRRPSSRVSSGLYRAQPHKSASCTNSGALQYIARKPRVPSIRSQMFAGVALMLPREIALGDFVKAPARVWVHWLDKRDQALKCGDQLEHPRNRC
jgi:hypothetical protein